MLRRDFGKTALAALASGTLPSTLVRSAKGADVAPVAAFPKTHGVTDYVGKFVVNTTYEDIPADVVELGKELMLSYHVGVEVECKIAEAISPRHYQDGFHSTGTCGALGSAAASAKLLRFDQSKVKNVFGLAAGQSGGLRENFGTMTKPFQAGHAAESGV